MRVKIKFMFCVFSIIKIKNEIYLLDIKRAKDKSERDKNKKQ
jgi:hypothetical protein